MFKLILASASPRRKQLLEVAGLSFRIFVSEIDETPKRGEIPRKMVKRLSIEKAMAVIAQDLKQQKGDFIVLAADTTVVSPSGKNLGKPLSHEEAFTMLKLLQGKTHSVFTAYTVVAHRSGRVIKKISRVVQTKVTFKKLSSIEIKNYLSQDESMDKAGAYAAQGAGMMLVSKMNGSYTNVVGLPLSHVLEDLKKIGLK